MKPYLVCLLVLGFNLGAALARADAADDLLKKATFCHGFGENKSPKDTAEFFRPDEPVYLSVELKGRPKTGEVRAKFMFRDDVLAETGVDVATVNEGVIFSFGQNTFVGFDVTHKKPLPVGDCYLADVSFDGQPLGKFPFRVAPPKGALPSKLLNVTLAKGTDKERNAVDETREFDRTDKVVLVGACDLGLSSWLEVSWKVAGKVDNEGTRSFTLEENKENVPFSFSFIPEGGWPPGAHEVSLLLDGKEVAHEKFTARPGAPKVVTTKLVIQSAQLFKDDGQGEAGKEVKSFTSTDTELHARWNLKEEALAKGIQLAWVLVEAEGEEEQVLVTADVEPGVSDNITSSLTAKNGLPPGKYRIDLLQNGKVLDTKPFQVK